MGLHMLKWNILVVNDPWVAKLRSRGEGNIGAQIITNNYYCGGFCIIIAV